MFTKKQPFIQSTDKGPSGSSSGFALVISITLAAMTLLVLLSLAALVRVESGTASNQEKQTQAQRNALLGIQMAIGELQRLTGPDQRATAPAHVLTEDDADFPTPGNRFWTGVWDTETEDRLGFLVSGASQSSPNGLIDPFDFEATLVGG